MTVQDVVGNPKKIFLLKYVKEPKRKETLIRENEPIEALVNHLQKKWGIGRQQVYELALLSVGLKVPPEKLLPIIQLRKRSDSKKALAKAIEVLMNTEL